MRRYDPLIAAALLLAANGPAPAGVIAADLAAALRDGETPVPVIVELAERVDPGTHAGKARRAELIGALHSTAARTQPAVAAAIRAHGGGGLRQLWAINAIAASLPPAAVAALARHPAVARIRLDAEVAAPPVTPAAAAAPEWNIAALRVPELWTLGLDGSGVVVAGMDTGVDANHPDLAPRWRGGTNGWYDPNGQHATPYDRQGHGTQTMAIMVGGTAGGSAIGVAPGARWIAVKIFDDSGRSRLSRIHQGFQWLLDPDGNPATDDAPDVVNNSWGLAGSDQCSLEFQADLRVLKAAGIAVLFSAGNDGPAGYTSSSPANNPEGYAVGAVDAAGTVAPFSSRGPSACDGTPYPELVAPGVAVRSADLSFGGIANYVDVSGTSYAAPHLAGVMALLIQARPGATVADLEAALLQSARDLGPAGPDHAYGYGLADAAAALDALAGLPPPQNRPPHAGNDAYSVLAGTTLAVATPGLLGNDADPDGDPLSALLDSPPGGGSLTLRGDGSFSYVAAPGTLADSFTYRASDGSLSSAAATVSISVIQPNQAPVAADDSATTRKNTALRINVLANDRDPDGSLVPGSLAIVGKTARGGTATAQADGTVAFSPKRNFTGTDSFVYRVQDNLGAVSNPATVTVTVTR